MDNAKTAVLWPTAKIANLESANMKNQRSPAK